MRYFNNINNSQDIFFKIPSSYNLFSSKEDLSYALGACLYMPGTRENLLVDILFNKSMGAHTITLCIEDSVSTNEVVQAENNIIDLFMKIALALKEDSSFLDRLPLIFIRVRNIYQLQRLLDESSLTGLCGFIFPKFNAPLGEEYFSLLKEYNESNKRTLYGMPILETPNIIHKETRVEELIKIKHIVDYYKDYVLNIRIGGTDFSGLYSLRRSKDFTVYDLTVVQGCISDIINVFKRDNYVISGVVYEYYSKVLDLNNNVLIKETLLDRTNGLIGKTVIHPTQVNIVNSLMVVSKEDYIDASNILSSSLDGVIKSNYSNKMNEIKPHEKWAKEILLKAKIMGVFEDGKSHRELLQRINSLQHR
ncbi:HpcH/HpaI aldolase/citrate lyase family protein [Clostridium tagluense]|uniref:HpcH/HpaI aldolase/citrate lyase family protein n=1 Tax=Clostridium tagluense TaxID=360422 RepID=UPI001C0AB367|nr:HpcH/HpaI aldolase/citrate lyase family protein [Clostridium tagluense]MBU3130029.1 HpcH/HpaI aldolase/citrate lyase family protein [Clostridium tagluense]MCB2313508.1 HpcH/HpaI aldolase/citrate lyase family protein [Clostridium tagluense]MCB2318332.1 HpcH/HpaI aldolase/citrate lyase family protein [Clostridium tagluense]MCB2323110.1 HpcH/HpaI aldolase/citrate lyase family protein [Clostridium tagluense]MCB2328093.1 HpcH/HpaI aldolase/citrate lyase family protein [Clostridium tagluense]